MAFAFVASNVYNSSSSVSIVITKPTGTADNDIMFALLKLSGGSLADPTTVPTGWTLGAKRTGDANNTYWVYYKVAASEGADYTWTWTLAATRAGGTLCTYRDGFNTSTPIDVWSNTAYITSDTIGRAASMTVAAANSPLIFFGCMGGSADRTFGPPTNPTTFTEDYDGWDTTSRFARCFESVVWTGSGATGNIDSTLSLTTTDKHCFAVALVPSGGGGGGPAAGLRTQALLGVGL